MEEPVPEPEPEPFGLSVGLEPSQKKPPVVAWSVVVIHSPVTPVDSWHGWPAAVQSVALPGLSVGTSVEEPEPEPEPVPLEEPEPLDEYHALVCGSTQTDEGESATAN